MSENLKSKVFEISGESIGLRDRLKEVLPQVFDANGSIDFDMLRELMGEGDISKHGECYGLSWCGQGEARRAMSVKTSKTLTPEREKSVDFDTTENIFIEGENLDVLRILQKAYYRKIKMIYIDPPYNTGNDSFVYDDDFTETKNEYLQKSGDIDEYGLVNKLNSFRENKKENGQYHSRWLSMMYPRLMLAFSLLTDDGVIFVSIDENEQANLKLLMNSVFGEDNCIVDGVVNKSSESATEYTVKKHEYFVGYAKDKYKLSLSGNKRYTISRGTVGNPTQTTPIISFPKGLKCINIPDGVYQTTRQIKGSSENITNFEPVIVENGLLKEDIKLQAKWRSSNDMRKFFDNNCNPIEAKINGIIEEIYFDGDRFMPYIKKLIVEKVPSLYENNKRGSKDLADLDLDDFFEFPKSVDLIKYLVQLFSNDSSIILDFFAGSGTTAQAVMELNVEDGRNRRFICVQLPEDTKINSEAYKAGYTKISDITAERIRRAGAKIKGKEDGDLFGGERAVDTGFKYYRLSNSHFKIWNDSGEDSDVEELLLDLVDATLPDSSEEEMLYELILKCGLMLTTRIEDKGEGLYYLPEEGMCVVLRRFDDAISEEVGKLEPKIVITIDRLFENDDARVSNMRLMYGERGIRLDII